MFTLRRDQIITFMEQHNSMTCLCCAFDQLGRLKANGYAQNINPFNVLQHLGSGDHVRRLGQGRGPAGPPYVVANPPVQRMRAICTACCLTREGHTRLYASRMEMAAVAAHVASGDHARRVVEGRFRLYEELHGRGQPHVGIGLDTW